MIFFGSRGTNLHNEQVSGIKCSHCEQTTTHTISIYGRYFHVWWIPTFPIGKKGFSECNNCKRTLESKEMNESLKLAYQNVNSNTKSPIWYWSGIGIVGVLIGLISFMAGRHDKDAITYINAPKTGDTYEYKPNESYSLLKVASVSQDSVFVISNDYEIGRQSKLYKIDKPENYTTEPYGISKDELKNLFESKDILDVDRD